MVQRSSSGGAPSLSYELWYTSRSIIGDVRYRIGSMHIIYGRYLFEEDVL